MTTTPGRFKKKMEIKSGTHFNLNGPAQEDYYNDFVADIGSYTKYKSGLYALTMRTTLKIAESDKPREKRNKKKFGTPIVSEFRENLVEIQLQERVTMIDSVIRFLSPSPNPEMLRKLKSVLRGTLEASHLRREDKSND